MVLTSSSRPEAEPFDIKVTKVPCRLVTNTYRTLDSKAVHKKMLMVPQLRSSDTHPTYRVQCLPADEKKAVALVVEKCREQCAANGKAQRTMEAVFAKEPTLVHQEIR